MSISNDEIKKAVWLCCEDKAPGPDGFNFHFIKRYWEIIKGDLLNAMSTSGKREKLVHAAILFLFL